ncbi:MAG: type II toxin-antitoxin system MqsR family toxin [Candidatus Hydrogenedentes bacterium]|nr:type II toxin-antitoxin system MqsR family toxin [Candidatus Hydrogenedentota bacterium]
MEAGQYRLTKTALQCAARDFGFLSSAEVATQLLAIEHWSFYKSMTAVHDSGLWQDVYRPSINGREAYVKVQILNDMTVVISFKGRE